MKHLKALFYLITFIYASVIFSANAGHNKKTGDILQIAIPLSALFYSNVIKDVEGIKELSKSYITSVSLTHVLKETIKRERPNGKNKSFPSGHSASAFSGAFYIMDRYGIYAGFPALTLAGIVAYSRITTKSHYISDVLGSILISGIFSKLFVNKYNFQVAYKERKMEISFRVNL